MIRLPKPDLDYVRAFFAIEINPELRAGLGETQNLLRLSQVREKSKLSLPPTENLHLTLHFLGDIPVSSLVEIDETVALVTQDFAPFDMTLRGAGAFPNLARPKVLWVGVEHCEALHRLHGALATALNAVNIPFDAKPFRPHLTLARVKFSEGDTLALAMKPLLSREFGVTPVSRLVLFRSELTSGGALYTTLAEWPLRPQTEAR